MKSTIKIERLLPKVYHINFKTQRELCSTFLRFEEFYESPEFKGKIFTLQKYIAWYKKTYYGTWTYYSDWSGFNMPGYILIPFQEGKFGKLSKKEQILIGLCEMVIEEDLKDVYIIGTYGVDKKTLDHELAHALYFVNPNYKKDVDTYLNEVDTTKLELWLRNQGYHSSVFRDECNAYISTSSKKWFDHKKLKIKEKDKKYLENLFKKASSL
jgi:hypothetical protein